MVFVKEGLVFVKKRVVEREGKKTLLFVTLADPDTFESNDFILNNESGSNFNQGDPVDAHLVVDNRFSSVIIYPGTPA